MFAKRTDLAMEAHELWQESAERTARLPGVKAGRRMCCGCPVHWVEVLDEEGEQALGKPRGSYLTVDLQALTLREEACFAMAVHAVAQCLCRLVPQEGGVLVAALGNAAMTPDAVGPLTAQSILVTRHLIRAQPRQFGGFRAVAVVRPGVLGTTGVESAETVRAIAERLKPAAVLAVDALASRRTERLCAAVQLSDSGIVPGSGVGNRRAALTGDTLGVPVIAVGIPTVVDAATLVADLLERQGAQIVGADRLRRGGTDMMVTPRDIDAQVRLLSRVAAYAINRALQGLEIGEITALLG